MKVLRVLWALPWTSVGLGLGLLGLATGGRVCRHGPVVECYGGLVGWLLERMPNSPSALTLGHAILGRTAAALDAAYCHELIHVGQYERWGPFFVPAYLSCSLILWLAGKNAYRDNPFERVAYRRQVEPPAQKK